jgi:hypothetical protein
VLTLVQRHSLPADDRIRQVRELLPQLKDIESIGHNSLKSSGFQTNLSRSGVINRRITNGTVSLGILRV